MGRKLEKNWTIPLGPACPRAHCPSWSRRKKGKTWELSTEIKTIEQRCFKPSLSRLTYHCFYASFVFSQHVCIFHLSFISWEDTACCPMTTPLSGNLFSLWFFWDLYVLCLFFLLASLKYTCDSSALNSNNQQTTMSSLNPMSSSIYTFLLVHELIMRSLNNYNKTSIFIFLKLGHMVSKVLPFCGLLCLAKP